MLNNILEQLLRNTDAQTTTGIARFPQAQRQQAHLFGGFLNWLLNALRQRGAFSGNLLEMALRQPEDVGSQANPGVVNLPSPLNSSLITSPTRPSTVADTLAPGSGDASFQPSSLPTDPLLGARNKFQAFAQAKATQANPFLSALLRKR